MPRVADLFERRRPGVERAPPGMAEHFHTRFLNGPTYDPEIPSLVGVATDGTIIGFIGASVVPMLLDGRLVRAVATGPLITAQDTRAVSVFLVKALLAGPQEFTFSDRHTVEAHRLLVRVGARPMRPRGVWWRVALRPLSYRLQSVRRTVLKSTIASALAVPAALVDRFMRPTRLMSLSGRSARTQPLSADVVVGALPELTRANRLRPVYDAAFWDWRMQELGAAEVLGRPHALAVFDGDTLLGWFVYMVARRGASRVLQVCSRPGYEDVVLRELVCDANRHGVAALYGRLEPEFDLALRGLRPSLLYDSCLLVHSRNPAVFEAFATESAMVTPLDGEAWLSATFRGGFV